MGDSQKLLQMPNLKAQYKLK